MNATLAKIAHCKVELPTYLTWCLVVGSGGQRQEELGRYHLTGLDGTENRLFKSFISGNLVGTDYMNGPNGALDWVGSRIRHNFPRVHPKVCTPSETRSATSARSLISSSWASASWRQSQLVKASP